MGFLDFLKITRHKSKSIKDSYNIFDDQTKTLEEKNAAYLQIREEEIRQLNRCYDFDSIQGIRSIPVPCQEVNGASSTGRVEYYLRGQCFARHRDAGNIDLAVECIKKAHELMFISDIIWSYDSFISDISWLHSIGKHDIAWEEEERVDRHFYTVGFYPKLTEKDFSDTDSFLSWKNTIEKMELERLRKRSFRHEYYWFQENLPDLCPKSLSGYSRMKNANSKNYQKLVYEAAKRGKQI